MGGFFDFKLHLPINHRGQIMAFKITEGNADVRQPLEPMTAALRGKLVGNRGYIVEPLMQRLWQGGSPPAHWPPHNEEHAPPSAGQATAEKTIQH